jgi:hypothetical protein
VTLRYYVDTSVIGGCLDDKFREDSTRVFAMFREGRAVVVVSDLTLLELASAPQKVQVVLQAVPPSHRQDVELTSEAEALAEKYVAAGGVGSSQLVDAQHIAIATLARVDVLLSWNFKHVINLRRIHGFNSVNLREGLPVLEMRSPLEIADDA